MPIHAPQIESEKLTASDSLEIEPSHPILNQLSDPSRRLFLSASGGLTAMAFAGELFAERPLLGENYGPTQGDAGSYSSGHRASAAMVNRIQTAQAEHIDLGVQPDNGDLSRYPDCSAMFAKALKFDGLGVPNRDSFDSLRKALSSGAFADFEEIEVNNPDSTDGNSKLNGPQTSLAYDLEGLDSHATAIPPAPPVASAQTAAEQVEHYWAAMLRDVPFTQYESDYTVSKAVADINKLSFVRSAANNQIPYPVSPSNLFRGQIVKNDGNVHGPFVSQFLVQSTYLGAQPLGQRFRVFLPVSLGGRDYMTDPGEYQAIESGGTPSSRVAYDPVLRYLHTGRDLAAYTRVDILYQGYLSALLVLLGMKARRNPGLPYKGSKTEKAFGTLGDPDISGLLGEAATRALKAAWFHKWLVNMRLRPEAYGALIQAKLTGSQPVPQACEHLHADVLNSEALQTVRSSYGSWLLPQAFPEGSPTHPCYPTGHGAVGGACVTALKFFFDGTQRVRELFVANGSDVMVPSTDGTSLLPFIGADREDLDVNGELVKLAFNISTGHGIHAGIHFRSSTNASILLGEQVALSLLRDRASCYNEPFTVNLVKFDGTTTKISNQR